MSTSLQNTSIFLPNIAITYHANSFQCEEYDSEEEGEVPERPHGASGRYIWDIDKDVVQGDTEANEGEEVGESGEWRQVLETAYPVDNYERQQEHHHVQTYIQLRLEVLVHYLQQ